jgi:hypothetical protein
VEEVAAERGTSLAAVTYWAGPALAPRRGGRTHARPADRLVRLRPVVVEGEGFRFVTIRGSRRTRAAEWAYDVQYGFVEGRVSAEQVRALRGLRVGGYAVESDPAVLRELGRRRELDVEAAYRAVMA